MSLYPGRKAMTYRDAQAMDSLNRKNGYGLSYDQIVRLISAHEYARKHGDVRRLEMIEYRLTDINYHTECAMMHEGKYKELRDKIESEWR